MEISFQYANRRDGNTSILLRFDGVTDGQTVCLLVDAGQGVDVDALLDEDEYLTGILLTHLHYDHYTNLGEALRDGAQIYTAPPTAALIDDVLSVAATHADRSIDHDEISARTVAVEESTTIAGAIDVIPVPAGHAPGAAAFYLRFEDGTDTQTMLLTGDCTRRHAGGYPGIPDHEVDALLLNGATDDSFEAELTDAVVKTIELASAGSTTLVTANGLTGVQFAYVLGHTLEELDQELQITIAGHAATMYEVLEYDVPLVRSVTTYDHPDDVLEPGGVTISGPEAPTEGGSGRLFGAIRDQPGSALVQLLGGDGRQITEGSCTMVHHRLVNHPTQETLDELVADTDPEQIVMFHQSGQELAAYRDHFSRSVWAPNDSDEYTIYDEYGWRTPPWVSEWTRRSIETAGSPTIGDVTAESLATPVTRTDEPDLTAEGLDIEAVETRFVPVTNPDYQGGSADRSAASASGGATGETDTAVQTPDGGSGTHGGDASVSALQDRIDRLEQRITALGGDTDGSVPATVIELADGTVLLQPTGNLPPELEHGEVVRLRLRSADDSDPVDGPETDADDGSG